MIYRSLIILIVLLTACGGTTDAVQPDSARTAPAPAAAPTAAPTADPPGSAKAPACPAAVTDTIPASAGSMPNVTYDDEENTIRLEGAGATSMAALAADLDRPELLREVAPGEWYLAANLRIGADAELTITGPQVRWLKLRSDAGGFVWIKAFGGRLTFADTCVSSWDEEQQALDDDPDDGRSFVLARDGATMHIRRSMLHHLGYLADESYGVAYRLAGSGGEVIDSDLSYNYYGLYSYEVSGLLIRNNSVHHNLLYGIDPHTNSNRLLIEGNRAYANGKHGIILAEGCSDSIIRNNLAYDNDMHGIVLYNGSNYNLVEGNQAYGNGQQGININNADRNRIRDNTSYANGSDGIGVGQEAEDNLLIDNDVRDNREHGIHLYSEASGSVIAHNQVEGNQGYGIYVKSPRNRITVGNRIFGNRVGVYLNTADPPIISRSDNTIFDNREGDIATHSAD